MNPHNNPNPNPNQNPAPTSAVQQVNPVINQPMFNGNVGGLFPNNMPVAAQPCFMNFPSQPFLLQNTIGGLNPMQSFNPFPVNQFNPSQQQQGQFFTQNPNAYQQNVGIAGQQALLQNTIQNIYQLLQLQNPNYAQCPPGNFPMFPNQIVNVMNPQNPGLPVQHANHGSQNMGQQLQGNPFLPGASGSVQIQQPQNLHPALTNFQNQIPQGLSPQNHNLSTNQMFGMANMNATMQNVNQGPPGFVSPNDASHKGSKLQKHVNEKFGVYKGNMCKEGGNSFAADSVSQNSTKFEKKVPSLNYTEQEIKEWCEARKKNHPSNGAVFKKHKKQHTSQEAMLRRQQLKEILAKQAQLGCEVADIPASLLSDPDRQNPREKKRERPQYKKGKFQNKRGTPFQDRMAKKARTRDQKSNHETKREPSLLQKLLTQDIKRDKNHLLQVFRFITANSFFTGESLRFPSVVVRETNVDEETTCSVKVEEEEEETNVGEETTCSVVKADADETTCFAVKAEEEEEGEIID